jgi:HD-like signal output (HDOD) protein
VDPQTLQQHAQQSAAACKSLHGGRISADDAWLAGLLHDIGYWVLIQECPHEMAEAIELSRAQGLPLWKCEQEIIGATHAQVGAYLLGLWGLPYPIVEAVALHHTPTAIVSHGYDLLSALAVSHAMLDPVAAHALAPTPMGNTAPEVDASYLAGVSAPFSWEEAQRLVQLSATPAS